VSEEILTHILCPTRIKYCRSGEVLGGNLATDRQA